MKISKRLIAFFVAVILMLQFSSTAFASTSIFDSKNYTHQSQFDGYEIVQGIDVSYHNGDINWKSVKSAGVKFAILRVGYRGYAAKGTLMPDNKFAEYVKEAWNQGIPMGVYFYSQALTTDEAKAEAEYCLKKFKEATADIENFKLSLPIFYDYEFAGTSAGRLDSAWSDGTMTKTKMTNNALAFCNAIKNAGYDTAIYSNKDFMKNKYNRKTLENAGYGNIWLAHYTTKTDYDGSFNIWQATSSGKINGIKGNVDCNFMYIPKGDFGFQAQAIDDIPYSASPIEPYPIVSYKGNELKLGVDYYITFSNNIDIGTANIVITGVNDYAFVPSKVINFKIVPQEVTGVELLSRGVDTMALGWTAVDEADSYVVEQYKSGSWKQIAETKGVDCVLKKLSPATNNQFRLRAVKNISGENYESIPSSVLQAATKPAKVTAITTQKRTTTSLKLSWKKQTNASKYYVYKYNSDLKKYEQIATVKGDNFFTVKNLKANTAYSFRVRAVKVAKEGGTYIGENSETYKDRTLAPTPVITKATTPSARRLRVNWKKVSGVTGYQVKWSRNSDFSGSKTVTVKGEKTLSKTVVTARSKCNYYVKVRAYKTYNGKNIYTSWSKALRVKVK